MKLIFYVPTMSQYILHVMVADYCSILFCKCATNVVGVNGDLIFLQIFPKNTSNTQTWVSHSRFRANEPKLDTKYTDYCAKWKCAVE